MRTNFLTALGFVGLAAMLSVQANAKPKLSLVGATIDMGGGFFGLPGTITADATLPLFVISSSVQYTDGFGVLRTNYINQDIANQLSPLAAGQSYSGETDNSVLNGSGPFLFTSDYTINPPSKPIDSTGFLTINFREGSLTAPLDSVTVPFRTSAVPEPGTMALMTSGMAAGSLFLLRRRRK